MINRNALKNELVSIITPSYNSQAYISQTIESILAQTYSKWELLITDDCSTDQTIEIIKSYQKNDIRIRLFLLDKNQGAGVARNNSIKEANGRYIAFCDSDDLWIPEKLNIQIDFIVKSKSPLIFSSYNIIKQSGGYLKTKYAKSQVTYSQMLAYNYIGCLTVLYDSKKIGKRYFSEIRKRQDYAMWLTIVRQTKNARGIKQPLAEYRLRKGSVSQKKLGLLKYNWLVYYKTQNFNMVKSTILLIKFLLFYFLKRSIYTQK